MNKKKESKYSRDVLIEGIRMGDKVTLARAITLAESTDPSDKKFFMELLDDIPKSENTLRIGITGVPGVGKSTFVEAFGQLLITEGRQRIAVLSVDPTSSRSFGSILGDKTRMIKLGMNEKVFIRPSASGQTIGGVTSSTRDSILLCEAAGFDTIIVETVGVGQSETEVKQMVDFFLLLILPGGGDELQGIKRGIMEMADSILVNKSDINPDLANQTRREYQNALHLFPPNLNGWSVPVENVSAINLDGLEHIYRHILDFEQLTKSNNWFFENRKFQQIQWFRELLQRTILDDFYQKSNLSEKIKKAEKSVISAQLSPQRAVNLIMNS